MRAIILIVWEDYPLIMNHIWKTSNNREPYVFLSELIHAPVTAKEVAILSKVINYINYWWPNTFEEQLKHILDINHVFYGMVDSSYQRKEF